MTDPHGQVLIEIMGGPVGPEGPPNAGVFIVGIANTWPPAAAPSKGDLWILPATPPAGAPAWAVSGHGAFWDGVAWVDAGLLRGPQGDRGEPGPPLNVKGSASMWPPASSPQPGDIWQLVETPILGLPSGFKSGGAAAWDDVAKKWVPLDAIRGPAGHSVTVFGPSPTPPATAIVSKGDIWLASDPSVFSQTFDPAGIVQQPGPPGPAGPAGLSAFEMWRTAVGRPTASLQDYIDTIRGAKGDKGDKGAAGETFHIDGVVANQAALPPTPTRMSVYMTHDTAGLFVYDPTSAAALPSGYVDLGKIAGTAGPPARLSPSIADPSQLPPTGSAGEMVFARSNGHLYGWDGAAWIDGGKFGGEIDDGTAQGQVPTWDAGRGRWAPTDFVRLPNGVAAGDVVSWDAAAGHWVAVRHTFPKLQELSDVTHHASPQLGEAPVFAYATGVPAAQGVFQWASPNAHIKSWESTRHWESGSTVYHDGALWRATHDNGNVEPKMEQGRLTLYINVPGEPTFGIVPMVLSNNSPPTGNQPSILSKFGYWVETQSQSRIFIWKYVVKGMDPTTHAPYGEWEARPWQTIVWRGLTPPPKGPPGTVMVWVYQEPGPAVSMVLGQQAWAPMDIPGHLATCSDVDVSTPQQHDVLVYDATAHKWKAMRLAELAALLSAVTTP